jgi:hypothetical protein
LVCHKGLPDLFFGFVEPDPIAGVDPFIGAKLTFDPALGNLDLRLAMCSLEQIEEEVCPDQAPTTSEAGPGFRSLTWTNTTGEFRLVEVFVELTKGKGPVPYTLEMFQNIPVPPPPPPTTCGEGLPSDDQEFFASPGEYRFSGTVCPTLPDDWFGTLLADGSSISVNIQTLSSGTIDMLLSACVGWPDCEYPGSATTDETGAAFLAWTNCTGSEKEVFVDLALIAGNTPVSYELDIGSTSDPGLCP